MFRIHHGDATSPTTAAAHAALRQVEPAGRPRKAPAARTPPATSSPCSPPVYLHPAARPARSAEARSHGASSRSTQRTKPRRLAVAKKTTPRSTYAQPAISVTVGTVAKMAAAVSPDVRPGK